MNAIRLLPWLTLLTSSGALAAPIFVERAEELGVAFHHFNGMTGETLFPEMMGAGVAMFDYDGDGDLDLYLVQGSLLGRNRTMDDALIPARHPLPLTDRLYRNRLVEDGQLAFEDVTDAAGLPASDYGMGVSVGDPNGDGRPDLYVSNLAHNRLLINEGGGRFRDATDAAGVDDEHWSIQSVFFDADGDGDEDLYVVNYVDFSFDNLRVCATFNDIPDYCSPQSYQPVADRLFLNDGDARFTDTTARSGLAGLKGHGLGVVVMDLNEDGRSDLYVANDGSPNFLLLNQGNARFMDEALMSGASVNVSGMAEASMGVDAGDFDNDGDLDLFMTHMDRQTNTLYVNDGSGWFLDRTGATRLGATSFPFTGFGTRWFDYDNDGWLDLFSANGAVVKDREQALAGDVLPLKQPNQLWRNDGKGDFEDTSDQAGPAFTALAVGRGGAVGDLDNDGDLDLVITNNGGPAQVFINQVGQQRHWIGLIPRSGAASLVSVGVRATVKFGDRTTRHRSRSDGSYVSAHDPRILVGLGDHDGPVSVNLVWPDGTRQDLELAADRYHVVTPPDSGSRP